jgi:uncharacterized damage-inducible protein DinB
MDTKDAIRSTMDMSLFVLNSYVSDLSDDELMRRPTAGCNHLAWQLGHLISSEVGLLSDICPGKGVELPAGFVEKHAKENCESDNPGSFCSKNEYLQLFQSVRNATLEALDELPTAALDAPSPERIRTFCPTVGHVFTLIGTHPMMHAGQFVVVRRQLGKPVVI